MHRKFQLRISVVRNEGYQMEIKRPLMEVIYLYCFQRFRCVYILHLHLFYVQSIFIHIPLKSLSLLI